MKKILCVLLFFGSVIANAQNPIALNLRVGYSEIKGLLGAEFQTSKFSIAGGWKPQKVWEREVSSYTVAFTYYDKQWYESGLYGSIGFSSKGYFYPSKMIDPLNVTGNYAYIPEPSMSLLLGMRLNLKDMISTHSPKYIVDSGIGLEYSKHSTYLIFEFLFSFNVFNNHIRGPKFHYN